MQNFTPITTQTGHVHILKSSNAVPVQSPNHIHSIHDELSVSVPQNIKDKIVKCEYIDLSILLANNDTNIQRLMLVRGEVVTQPHQNYVKIYSIDQWTTAFIIFSSIFCKVHTHRFQELLKYMSTVRQAAKRCSGMGWKIYDEQYRLRKANNPSSSWGPLTWNCGFCLLILFQ